MQKTIKAFIYPGETHYVAECVGLNIVTQGKTLDETVANLREAVDLYLEDESLTELDSKQNLHIFFPDISSNSITGV